MSKTNKSLLNLIKEAIITHSPKDVTIHQRPLATELIYSKKNCLPLSIYDFLPRTFGGKRFVLTRHLIFILRTIILFIIAIPYITFDLSHRLITGQWKGRQLTKKEIDTIKQNKFKPNWISVRERHCIPTISGLNAIIFFAAFVTTIIALIMGTHFLIKEVILPENESRINSHGIVTIEQGCLEEQHFFLLNAATFWTPTGIAVNKGDKVYISASGSMYSDVDEMVEDAKSNKQLNYPRSDFHGCYETTDNDARYCIFGRCPADWNEKENLPQFGSLLYQICGETTGPKSYNGIRDDNAVQQIIFTSDERFSFSANTSGILYFCFNDIFLDDKMIDNIHNSSSPIKTALDNMCPDTITDLHKQTWLKKNVDSTIWFQDNLGEALINVRIIKNLKYSNLSYFKKTLIHFQRCVYSLYNKTGKGFWHDFFHSNLLIIILVVLAWFIIDERISRKLKQKKEQQAAVTENTESKKNKKS